MINFIKLKDSISVKENTLIDLDNGNALTIESNSMEFITDIKEGNSYEFFLNKYENVAEIICCFEKYNFLIKNDNELYDCGLNHLSSSLDSFFGLDIKNVNYLLNSKENKVALITINGFSSNNSELIDLNSSELIRKASNKLYDINDINENICDLGNLDYINNSDLYRKYVCDIGMLINNYKNILPIYIGGDHSVTYYLLNNILEKGNKFQIIQFDAHSDVGNINEKGNITNGNFMGEIAEKSNVKKVIQFGVRKHERNEKYKFNTNKIKNVNTIVECMNEILEDIPIYITIDLDVIDSSLFTAVNFPLSNGLTKENLNNSIEELVKKYRHQLLGIDIVEYNAKYDIGNNICACYVCELLFKLLENLKYYGK